MSLFKKKKKVPDNEYEYADYLLRSLWSLANAGVENLVREEQFRDIDRGKIFFELATLGFWDLNLLGCPLDLWQSALNRSFEITQCDKELVLRLMEERSKSYFEAWGDGKSSDSLMLLSATVARNIDEKLTIQAWLPITAFFSSLDGMNAKNLKGIKEHSL